MESYLFPVDRSYIFIVLRLHLADDLKECVGQLSPLCAAYSKEMLAPKCFWSQEVARFLTILGTVIWCLPSHCQVNSKQLHFRGKGPHTDCTVKDSEGYKNFIQFCL